MAFCYCYVHMFVYMNDYGIHVLCDCGTGGFKAIVS